MVKYFTNHTYEWKLANQFICKLTRIKRTVSGIRMLQINKYLHNVKQCFITTKYVSCLNVNNVIRALIYCSSNITQFYVVEELKEF